MNTAQPRRRLTVHERRWAPGVHVAAIPAMLLGIGFVGPLLVGRRQGGGSDFIRHHVVQAANFNITVCLANVVTFFVLLVSSAGAPPRQEGVAPEPQWVPAIAFSVLIVLLVYWFVFTIRAMIATVNGEWYRYPPSLRLVR